MFKSGDAIGGVFAVIDPATGALAAADAPGPVGTLEINGVDNAATVTIATTATTGKYKWTCTLPEGITDGQNLEIWIAASVTVAGGNKVWQGPGCTALPADVLDALLSEPLTAQQIRDALLLAPTPPGTPADGSTDDQLEDLATAVDALAAAVGPGPGDGPLAGVITVTDGTDPIPLASVRVSLAGVPKAVQPTDGDGEVATALAAATYALAVQAAGYQPYVGTLAVTADGWTKAVELELLPTPAASTTPFVTGLFTAYFEGNPQAGQTIELQLHTLPAGDVGGAYDRDYHEITGVDGTCSFVGLVDGAVYLARRNAGPWRRITIDDADADGYVDLTSIFGP